MNLACSTRKQTGPWKHVWLQTGCDPRQKSNSRRFVSVRYGLAPGGLAALLEDDDAFALQVQRFLSEHQVPYTLPLYSQEGRYLFAAAANSTELRFQEHLLLLARHTVRHKVDRLEWFSLSLG